MIKINLLSTEQKEKELAAKQNWGLSIVVLGAFIILTIVVVVLLAVNSTLKAQIDEKSANITGLKSSLDSYTGIKKEILFIKDRLGELDSFTARKTDWSKILASLSAHAPNTVTLTSFDIDTKKSPSIKIMGYARDRSDVIKFRSELENTNVFENVNFQSSSKITKDNIELTDFVLTADLKKS